MTKQTETAFALFSDALDQLKKGLALLSKTANKKTGSIFDRVQTIEDAFIETGRDYQGFLLKHKDIPSHIRAIMELEVMTEALNEEPAESWVNWANGDQRKWYPWHYMPDKSGVGFSFNGSYCDRTHADVGSRLVFKTEELSKYAGKQFLSTYKTWKCI